MVATKLMHRPYLRRIARNQNNSCGRWGIGMLLLVMVPVERLLDHIVHALERRI
ncbi:MAG: hypothetical protein RIQ28_1681 [Pseudomonadota bacterium]|jgi:hypothetical protein